MLVVILTYIANGWGVQLSHRLADFYREIGDLFGIELSQHNRWGGFGKLRERWTVHLESTLTRPVLLIDEAQEVPAAVLNELRLLSSAEFDYVTYSVWCWRVINGYLTNSVMMISFLWAAASELD